MSGAARGGKGGRGSIFPKDLSQGWLAIEGENGAPCDKFRPAQIFYDEDTKMYYGLDTKVDNGKWAYTWIQFRDGASVSTFANDGEHERNAIAAAFNSPNTKIRLRNGSSNERGGCQASGVDTTCGTIPGPICKDRGCGPNTLHALRREMRAAEGAVAEGAAAAAGEAAAIEDEAERMRLFKDIMADNNGEYNHEYMSQFADWLQGKTKKTGVTVECMEREKGTQDPSRFAFAEVCAAAQRQQCDYAMCVKARHIIGLDLRSSCVFDPAKGWRQIWGEDYRGKCPKDTDEVYDHAVLLRLRTKGKQKKRPRGDSRSSPTDEEPAAKQPLVAAEPTLLLTCSSCNKAKQKLEDFSKNQRSKGAKAARCKACVDEEKP